MKFIVTVLVILTSLVSFAQNITPKKLLENTINYHDPNGNWPAFNGSFTVVMTTPKSSKRTSVITINLPTEYFSVEAKKDTIQTAYSLDKGKCKMMRNKTILDSITASEQKMSCDRATLYKNYYTSLYGLPMKLNDFGTNLGDTVEQKTFKGKNYLVLKATYDASVGSDVWYFYFNPKTYAIEIYQFFKTDDNGKEKPESGEYIMLSEEAIIHGIKMPRIRAWYYNKDDVYLGTDTLITD